MAGSEAVRGGSTLLLPSRPDREAIYNSTCGRAFVPIMGKDAVDGVETETRGVSEELTKVGRPNLYAMQAAAGSQSTHRGSIDM
jgi:hypothetical protein